MKAATKSAIKSIMEMTQNTYKTAIAEATRISSDRDLSEEAKIRRAEAARDTFTHNISLLRDRLKEEKEKATNELKGAKNFNSKHRLINSDYQNRVILEGNFIKNLPLSLGSDIIKERLAVFYGDELARQYLTAVIEEKEETRQDFKDVFIASDILPDIYNLQTQMIEKLFSALDNKLATVQSSYFSKINGAIEQEKAETVAIFMEGLFKGISDYMDSLPQVLERPQPAQIPGVDFENIPAYALSTEDLNINFSMYRAK